MNPPSTLKLHQNQLAVSGKTTSNTGHAYLHARYYNAELTQFIPLDWRDRTEASVGTNR